MLKTLLVYFHLIATCAAIGTILITDLRFAAKALGYKVVIAPPNPFAIFLVTSALLLLYVTGAAIVYLGWQTDPGYLANQKLQAKLVLVGLLTANALLLHRRLFPWLQRPRPVSRWGWADWLTVAISGSLSNSLWFFCAFLGIARVWNGTVSLTFVLTIAALVWAVIFLLLNLLLLLASREEPKDKPSWIDSFKRKVRVLSHLSNR